MERVQDKFLMLQMKKKQGFLRKDYSLKKESDHGEACVTTHIDSVCVIILTVKRRKQKFHTAGIK